jgi:hypothetical protein
LAAFRLEPIQEVVIQAQPVDLVKLLKMAVVLTPFAVFGMLKQEFISMNVG